MSIHEGIYFDVSKWCLVFVNRVDSMFEFVVVQPLHNQQLFFVI